MKSSVPSATGQVNIPAIDQNMLRVFRWFIRGYVRKRFHAVAVNAEALAGMELQPEDSLVVYANHSSWWDPLAAMLLADRFFTDFRLYAPIDAAALAKYRMFARLGFFGVDQSSLRGAAEFLKISRQILSMPQASIWITPEGRFVDVRDESAGLHPGLAHLAASLAKAGRNDDDSHRARTWIVPGAAEYVFWEEAKPELLCWFGEPVLVASTVDDPRLQRCSSKAQWNQLLLDRLRNAQARLAKASILRDSQQFDILLGGSGGTFFVYDWWRRGMARLRGQRMSVDHSDKLQTRR